MPRNRTMSGGKFDDVAIQLVWDKAIPDLDDPTVKRDVCGTEIRRSQYGQESKHGWEIDHKYPVSRGGTDNISNLQPLHWSNNRSKGDKTMSAWDCGRT